MALCADFNQITPVHRLSYIVYYSISNGQRVPNGQASMKGHVTSYRLDTAEVFKRLPLTDESVKLRVLISNAYTSEQRRNALKPYEVRRERVSALLEWFRANHPDYRDIKIDQSSLLSLPNAGVMPGMVQTEDETAVLSTIIRNERETKLSESVAVASAKRSAADAAADAATAAAAAVTSGAAPTASASTGPSFGVPADAATSTDSTARAAAAMNDVIAMSHSIPVPRPNITNRSTSVELRSLINDSAPAATAGTASVDGNADRDSKSSAAAASSASDSSSNMCPPAGSHKVATYDIMSSSDPYWNSDRGWMSRSFVSLFPFGRGGLDESRKNVSVERCVEHYLRLSSRQFQAPDFALHTYDMLARMRVTDDVFLKAKMNIRRAPESKDNLNAFGTVSVATLEAAVKHLEAKSAAAKASRTQPDVPDDIKSDSDGATFLSTIQQVAGVCAHTPEYALRMRSRIFGYSSHLGAATFWYDARCTLANDFDSSHLLCHCLR
jgi:hypothetical protein